MRRTVLLCFLSMSVLFLSAHAAWAVKTSSGNLPPCAPAHYVTESQFHAEFPTANPPFTISAVDHQANDGCGGYTPPTGIPGTTQTESFGSDMTVMTNYGRVSGSGGVTVDVTTTANPQVYDTEMTQMLISFPIPFGLGYALIQEDQDPNKKSVGQTTIMPMGGMYSITSFFDVFTELSLDGGMTWHDASNSGRVTLVPEPTSLVLFGLGFVGLFGRRSRLR